MLMISQPATIGNLADPSTENADPFAEDNYCRVRPAHCCIPEPVNIILYYVITIAAATDLLKVTG